MVWWYREVWKKWRIHLHHLQIFLSWSTWMTVLEKIKIDLNSQDIYQTINQIQQKAIMKIEQVQQESYNWIGSDTSRKWKIEIRSIYDYLKFTENLPGNEWRFNAIVCHVSRKNSIHARGETTDPICISAKATL
jgi:hypothetical protein